MASDNKNKPSSAPQQSNPPSSASARSSKKNGMQTHHGINNPSSVPSRPPRTGIIQKRNF